MKYGPVHVFENASRTCLVAKRKLFLLPRIFCPLLLCFGLQLEEAISWWQQCGKFASSSKAVCHDQRFNFGTDRFIACMIFSVLVFWLDLLYNTSSTLAHLFVDIAALFKTSNVQHPHCAKSYNKVIII